MKLEWPEPDYDVEAQRARLEASDAPSVTPSVTATATASVTASATGSEAGQR
jgi:hypothetical protein